MGSRKFAIALSFLIIFSSLSYLFANSQSLSSASTFKVSGYCIDTLYEVGSYNTPHAGYEEVKVNGNHAYIADYNFGLRIIDISDYSNLTEVGHLSTIHNANSIAVKGNYAYIGEIAGPSSGVEIVDISNLSNPTSVSFAPLPSDCYEIAQSGNYVYVGTISSGLRIIDISNPFNPIEVGSYTTSNMVSGVAVKGNYVYLSEYDMNNTQVSGMRILDISDPTHPQEVSYFIGNGPIWGVTVDGNYAYLSNTWRGIRILDISNPSNPIEISSLSYFENLIDVINVMIDGNYAYVSNDYKGLYIVDISDKYNPFVLSSYNTNGVKFADETNNMVYVVEEDLGFHIINAQLKPIQDISLTLSGDSNFQIYSNNSTGYYEFTNLTSYGNYTVTPYKDHYLFTPSNRSYSGLSVDQLGQNYTAVPSYYVTVYSQPTGRTVNINGGLYTTPYTYNSATGTGVSLDAYVPQSLDSVTQLVFDSWSDGGAQGHTVYPGSDTSFTVSYDTQYLLTTMANPTTLGYVIPSPNPNYYISQSIWVKAGDTASCQAYPISSGITFSYWTGDIYGTDNPINIVMDGPKYIIGQFSVISSPAPYRISGYCYSGGSNMTSIGLFNINPPNTQNYFLLWLKVKDNHAFISVYYSGLDIVDISNPTSPQLVGSYPLNDARKCEVQGQYAYLMGDSPKLYILDISDYTNPTKIGTFDFTGYGRPLNIAFKDNYAYMISQSTGLFIIDVSVPSNPTTILFIPIYNPYSIAIEGNYAYIGATHQVVIFDISNPTSPVQVGVYNNSGSFYPNDIEVRGNYVYTANLYSGLRIIDVSNFSNMTEIGYYDSPGYSLNVAVRGNLVYLADNFDSRYRPYVVSGMQVIDVSNPSKPIVVDHFGSYIYDVTVDDKNVYVLDNYYGLYILKSTPASNIQVTLTEDTSLVTSSDSTGYYEFDNLGVGNYSITASKDRYTFSPSTRTYTGLSLDQLYQNYIGMFYPRITFDTNPTGLKVKINGVNHTTPSVMTTTENTNISINVDSPQSTDTSTRYLFNSWSDGGIQSHSIIPSTDTTFIANFDTQYYLTMTPVPGSGGAILYPSSNWYYQNSTLNCLASANPGYHFTGWGGDFGGIESLTTLFVNSPKNITANFILFNSTTWDNSMGDFSYMDDLYGWGFEKPSGTYNLPIFYWTGGVYNRNGVLLSYYTYTTSGLKMTDYSRFNPDFSNPWYTLRVSYYCESLANEFEIMPVLLTYPNNSSFQIQEVGATYQGKGKMIAGQWNTLDANLYCRGSSGLLQLVVKNNHNLSAFYIDSIELIHSAPSVVSSYSNISVKGGNFEDSSALSYWSVESTLEGINGLPGLSWSTGIGGEAGALAISFDTVNEGVKFTSIDTYSVPTGMGSMMSFKVYSSIANPTGVQVIGLLYNIGVESSQSWSVGGYGNLGNFSGDTWNTVYVPLTNGTSSTERLQLVIRNTSRSPVTVYIDDIQLVYDPGVSSSIQDGYVYLSSRKREIDWSLGE